MINIIRTDSDNEDFRSLVKELDAYLREKDGSDHAFYNQYNKLDRIKHTLVAYVDSEAAGIGSIREYENGSIEVKRMYVKPAFRNRRLAAEILTALESWASELGFKTCILETGRRQPEAINLYLKSGYTIIPNYGQYADMDNSVCMKKEILSGN